MKSRIAHISDLHFGRIKTKRLIELKDSLKRQEVDHIMLTGDITDTGKQQQWDKFQEIFKELMNKIVLVPGNHDRVGDDVAQQMMDKRVETLTLSDEMIHIIKVDTTGPHNKALVICHGIVGQKVLNKIEDEIEKSPKDHLIIIMFHHHPIKLPADTWYEKLASWINWTSLTMELKLGQRVIDASDGHVDMILHGHRHTPSSLLIPNEVRPLAIYNAGSTPGLRRYRIFECENGKLVDHVKWVSTSD